MRKSVSLPKVSLIWMFLFLVPIFILVILVFETDSLTKLSVLTIAAFLYITIALLHHHQEKSLRLEVIVEYVLIAILALIVILGILI